MTTEIAKKQKCVLLRNDIEIWIDEDQSSRLIAVLDNRQSSQFIELQGQLINRSDVTGIFTAEKMEEKTRRKNGAWQCEYRKWHDKNTKCKCLSEQQAQSARINCEEHEKLYGGRPAYCKCTRCKY